jgi:hypothetical protein
MGEKELSRGDRKQRTSLEAKFVLGLLVAGESGRAVSDIKYFRPLKYWDSSFKQSTTSSLHIPSNSLLFIIQSLDAIV